MKLTYRWADLTQEEIGVAAKADNTVVVIPVGSIEQHGLHLRVQTDARIVSEIAERAVKKVSETVSALLVPTITIRCSKHHMEFSGTLTLSEEILVRPLTEIGLSIAQHGFRRIFFLNGHGGNTAPLQLVVNEIHNSTEGSAICATADYWRFIREDVQEIRRSEMGGISHSGEFETSAMLALDASLVNMSKAEKFLPNWSNDYFMQGWYVPTKVGLGFHLKDITQTGVVGDPTVATKENGKRFLEAPVTAVAKFIEAFASWEFTSLYKE
ncbi:MAG: creatininase family protein [Nitrospiraceae bacterium]|nr:creatininase family protein [Nitrospiraceae bacterium]